MSAALHILRGKDHIAAFDLQPGSHLLGIGEDADLVLSDAHAKNDLCDVEVTPEPQVTLRALPNIPLRSPHREASAEMILTNGRFVEVSGLTITLLRTSDLGDVQVDPPRSVPVTAKSTAHEHVSAWHAEVVQKADGLWLNDLTSCNGTFLNGTIFGSGAIPKGAPWGKHGFWSWWWNGFECKSSPGPRLSGGPARTYKHHTAHILHAQHSNTGQRIAR